MNNQYKSASLTSETIDIVKHKATERPFTGKYNLMEKSGTYLCRLCGLALFRADAKFQSTCGWPSFDAEIEKNVLREPDQDGRRTEILCIRCHAHLGHVFTGEGLTAKNTRHCVNSLSVDFVSSEDVLDTEEAIFAAGCFWGVEYYFKKLPGVLKVEVGYAGGDTKYPSYQDVCSGSTGHYEVIRVIYDRHKTNYEAVCKYFFEIHDPEQRDGQGPDLGEQYLSVIFYYDDTQRLIAESLIKQLRKMHIDVATTLRPVTTFWVAEDYHQDYYAKTGKQPYCHRYVKRF